MDGWAGYELRQLPMRFWEKLANLYEAIEMDPCPTWPTILATASIAMIPKGEGLEPTKQKHIIVFSYIY